jgi:hypothetical protein
MNDSMGNISRATRGGRMTRVGWSFCCRAFDAGSATAQRVWKSTIGPMQDSVANGGDLTAIGQLALGQSPAELSAAVRTARRLVRQAQRTLDYDDLIGAIAPRDELESSTLRRVAVHEAGHAVVALALGVDEFVAVSIGRGGGCIRSDGDAATSRHRDPGHDRGLRDGQTRRTRRRDRQARRPLSECGWRSDERPRDRDGCGRGTSCLGRPRRRSRLPQRRGASRRDAARRSDPACQCQCRPRPPAGARDRHRALAPGGAGGRRRGARRPSSSFGRPGPRDLRGLGSSERDRMETAEKLKCRCERTAPRPEFLMRSAHPSP